MAASLLQGKQFYCRDWAFSKLQQVLDLKAGACGGCGGVLVTGGPGCGKTAFCCELVWPTCLRTGALQQDLSKRVLAAYFCQAHDIETLSLINFIHSLVEQLSSSSLLSGFHQHVGGVGSPQSTHDMCEANPDEVFKRSVLLPLLALAPPAQNLVLVVDSVDESYLTANGSSPSIAELLASHVSLLPPWLLLICSARKHSKSVVRLFTGFRKLSLDDLRKSHVVRDVQQYILSRLDREESLRRHLSRETADMLNQLHIKSNGCFLYLERVLDGVADGFVLLREVRDIPGTLNGLYLWICQRIFTADQFACVQPTLCVMLAARRPLTLVELYSCAYTRDTALILSEFTAQIGILFDKLLLVDGHDDTKILFHHSFAEWLLDIKHCTSKYLCNVSDGHAMLALSFSLHAQSLAEAEVYDLALHLSKSGLVPPLQRWHLALWLQVSGAAIEQALQTANPHVGRDVGACSLLRQAGLTELVDSQPLSSSEPLHPTDDPVVEMLGTAEADSEVNSTDASGRSLLAAAAYAGNLENMKELLARGAVTSLSDRHGQTALTLAARQGHAEVVDLLISYKADVNHSDQEGWTALRSAAWGGHVDVVQSLLKENASVDNADSDGRTALRAAAWGGHEDIVKLLIEQAADINAADKEGRTALIAASYMGHVSIVERLLHADACIDHADADGRTALSVASLCVPASKGHAEVVTLLLELGAAVDHRDNDEMTPLLVAAYEGHGEVCELLLEHDADIDHADANGRTPLQAAVTMGHPDVVRLLLFWGAAVDTMDADGRTVLCLAAQQGSLEVVQQLLERGLDEGHGDNVGWRPLHACAFEGHSQVCELLLECGARSTEIDNEGQVALHVAAQEGHYGCVDVLLRAGSPPDARAHDGRTPLRVAAIEGHVDIVRLLLESGANSNYVDTDGRSTLYVLALEGETDVAMELLAHGAEVEERDAEGRTALHVAAWQGRSSMLELLINHGATVNAVDAESRTAIQSAAWQGHAHVVAQLVKHGANIDHQCSQGATALCIAAQEGHIAVVRTLLKLGADPNHADQYGRTALRVALKASHTQIVSLLQKNGAVQSPPSMRQPLMNDKSKAMATLIYSMVTPNGNSLRSTTSESSDRSRQVCNRRPGNSISSGHVTSSSGSSPINSGPGALSFTQQLQRCSAERSRRRLLSPVQEPQLALGKGRRDNAMAMAPSVDEPVWQHRADPAQRLKCAVQSPETRRRRNGIVTNPNFNSTPRVKLAARTAAPPCALAAGAAPKVPPHAPRPRQLPLKKETPL